MSSNPVPEPARWSLAARLATWYAGASFLLVLGTMGFLYWALTSSLEREDDEFLADKIEGFRQLLREGADEPGFLRREVEWEGRSRQFGQVYVRILDGRGHLVIETPGMSEQLGINAFPPPGPPGQAVRGQEVQATDNRTLRVAAVAAALGGEGRQPGIIQVAMDRTFEEEIMGRYRSYLALTLVAALLLCSLVSYRLVRRGLRPLREFAATARSIRSSTLHERMAMAGLPSDLAELAFTFNAMLDRLQEAFARLGQFSADIAHELRTPLSNLRSEAEVALRQARSSEEYAQVLGSCLEESVRLSGLVETLLFLARADQPRAEIQRSSLDLAAELTLIRDFFEATAAETGVTLQVDAASPCWAEADRALIQRALSNLVTNALNYTPAGGTVALQARANAHTVELSVADTGSGIEAQHLPFIFDRFYRADAARANGPGHVGLGLAIVASITRLHGGKARAFSAPGKGTRIELEFPVKHEGRCLEV
jgi:two-component system, OmpR family, heavy metal sensor histidine kinase CusS